jgi:hypothetical protein
MLLAGVLTGEGGGGGVTGQTQLVVLLRAETHAALLLKLGHVFQFSLHLFDVHVRDHPWMCLQSYVEANIHVP